MKVNASLESFIFLEERKCVYVDMLRVLLLVYLIMASPETHEDQRDLCVHWPRQGPVQGPWQRVEAGTI